MIKTFFIFIISLLLVRPTYCQKSFHFRAKSIPDSCTYSIDKLSSYIRGNFTTDNDRVHAIYIWITYHIDYDVARFEASLDNYDLPLEPVSEILNSRKAVCQGYSDLFSALCNGVGIPVIEISGFCKNRDQLQPVPHAWIAARVEGTWYLFDPTWGAGYVSNHKFVPLANNTYYKVEPEFLLKNHLPFDPLFQMVSRPISFDDFKDGKTRNNKTNSFNYIDSLELFVKQSPTEQKITELRRLQWYGIENDLLRKRMTFLEQAINFEKFTEAYRNARLNFLDGTDLLRTYMNHRNHHFNDIEVKQLQEIFENLFSYLKSARAFLYKEAPQSESQKRGQLILSSELDRLNEILNKEKEFVNHSFNSDIIQVH